LGATGFIYAVDVNGDGHNDLLTTMAHDYGVFWMEHGEGNTWTKRLVDDTWSQAHASTLIDLNRDGRLDLVTGKRYMAHAHDPGAREPLGLYWYEFGKSADGKKIDFARHLIDYSSSAGAGMQIAVADIDGDGDFDFAVGGKSGLFLFENRTRKK